jgi:antitoxin CptB
MDLLMGSFADTRLAGLSEPELDEFERLLDVPDWEIYAWLVGAKLVPQNHQGPVLDELIAFRYAAQPG